MAECKQTAFEFVQDAFPPLIAASCSHDAEVICRKNNLSFCELILPFCRLTAEARIQDHNNVSHPVRNLHLCVKEISATVPNPTAIRRMLHDAVASCQPPHNNKNVVTFGQYDLQFNVTTPWYEAYREMFLQNALPSEHEFLKHYLACLFVVSSNHADPLDQFNKLTQQQHNQQHGQSSNSTKWFCPNILRYYILLHDVSDGDAKKAESVYQSMKETYGINACHLLQINSLARQQSRALDQAQSHTNPNPWGQYLNKDISTVGKEESLSESMISPMTTSVSFPGQLMEDVETQRVLIEAEAATEVTEENGHPLCIIHDTPDTNSLEDRILGRHSYTSNKLSSSGLINVNSSIDIDNIDFNSQSPDCTTKPTLLSMTNVDNTKDNDGHVSENNFITHSSSSTASIVSSSTMVYTDNNKYSGLTLGSTGAVEYGCCLSLSDHDRLRIFIQEFVTRGLIPWSERTLKTLYELLASRKGIHRSIFSATKKLFGGSKPASPQALIEKANVVYTPEAPEMQVRRLADLSFMFQMYDLAYQTYHTAKRDFSTDHAWLYYAGALEMAAISVFLQNGMNESSNRKSYPQSYMESAISTYLNTCRSSQFSTRATLLCTEALKSKCLYSEAALQFIKMTSEDSDLRSALLLEQAAHCFLKCRQVMVRKYAFHMILAGHRFSKSNQRRHALRCYVQALQVYKGKGWSLAMDHINFTIGRHSCYLRQIDNAISAFGHLLSLDSKQSPVQQASFLKEYLVAVKQQLTTKSLAAVGDNSSSEVATTTSDLPQLPLPLMEASSTKVTLATQPSHTVADSGGISQHTIPPSTYPSTSPPNTNNLHMHQWGELEAQCIHACRGSVSPMFKPTLQCYTSRTNNTANPVIVQNEYLTVEVVISNPLKVALVLTDVMLLWKFVPTEWDSITTVSDGTPPLIQAQDEQPASSRQQPEVFTNEHREIQTGVLLGDTLPINSETIPEIVLSGSEKRPLQLRLQPLATGELHIMGLVYSISCSSLSTSVSVTHPFLSPAATGTATAASNNQQNKSQSTAVPQVPCSVRGHQLLEITGPRLNSTKQEMCSQLYGPDRRLDLLVTGAMPRLQLSATFPSAMLCGEVQRINISFTNIGSLPLHHLYLASTHPELITFLTTPNSNTANMPATTTMRNNCDMSAATAKPGSNNTGDHIPYLYTSLTSEGVHSTVSPMCVVCVPIPHDGNNSDGDQTSGGSMASDIGDNCGIIQPGTTITVPMWLRGPEQPGEHHILLLFYYESLQSIPKMRHRVLQHSIVLTASPFLSLQAIVQRSDQPVTSHCASAQQPITVLEMPFLQAARPIIYQNTYSKSGNSMTISLNINNVCDNNPTKIRVLQVSAVSDSYALRFLCPDTGSDLEIGNNSSAFISFKADRFKYKLSADQDRSIFTDVVFNKHQISSSSTPCIDFYLRSQLIRSHDHKTITAQVIENEQQIELAMHVKNIKRATHANVCLCVLWQATHKTTGAVIYGQNHVVIDQINTNNTYNPIPKHAMGKPPVLIRRSNDGLASTKDCFNAAMSIDVLVASQLLHATYTYNNHVIHNFTKHRLCKCIVTLHIFNCCGVTLNVCLKATKPTQDTAISIADAYSFPSFTWVGLTTHFITLAPHASNTLSITAGFSRSGVYDLSLLKLTAGPQDELLGLQMTQQLIAPQVIVNVIEEH